MFKKLLFLTAVLLFAGMSLSAQVYDWYVSPTGRDLDPGNPPTWGNSPDRPFETIQFANSICGAGDTVHVMAGTYHNEGYGGGSKNLPPVVNLHTSGAPGAPITFKNYDHEYVKLEYDGNGGFFAGTEVNYIVIEGFEIQGPAQSITYDEAERRRLDNPKLAYYHNHGIALWGHHLEVRNCVVHDCCSSGIRADCSDHVTFEDNVVYRTGWWTAAATSGIGIATAESADMDDTVKIILRRNICFDNWNRIRFFNPLVSDPHSYGGELFQYIIDGQGMGVTRNMETYEYGRMRIENNICFNNGINGIAYHKTNRGEVVNNTVFMNGAWPGDRPNTGMTVHSAADVKLFNNIIWPRKTSAGQKTAAFKAYDSEDVPCSDIDLRNNVIFNDNGLSDFTEADDYVEEDPLFTNPCVICELPGSSAPVETLVNTSPEGFQLTWLSPCINRGVKDLAPSADFGGTSRPVMGGVDVGVYEYTGSHRLEADSFSVSKSSGGVVNFRLNAGPGNAYRSYLMLGTLTGTVPGFAIESGEMLPINYDPFFTEFVMYYINTALFKDFDRDLDQNGQGLAQFNTGPFSYGDGEMHYAFYLNTSPWGFVSNPIPVEILP